MFFNPMNTVKPRRFEYEFRYYKSDEDKEKKIEFRRILKSPEPASGSLLRLFIMLMLIVITFIYLGKKGGPQSLKQEPKAEPIKVEEIVIVE
jgi:hypothetical protein